MPDGRTARALPASRPELSARSRRLIVLLAVALLAVTAAFPAMLQAASGPKVVVIVGPVGRYNAGYKEEAREIIAEARRYTSNVVAVFTPKATWNRVREATRGASILVYFGHGWGYPSSYGPFDGDRMNGMALDPSSGANGTRRIYYGENRIRASIRLAPNAAVLLYRLCYASGNTEPRRAEGTTSQSKRRVDGFGAGFMDAGAAIVVADGHPKSPGNYIRQLFTTDRSMWVMFRRAPNYHAHVIGPYNSTRTPGARYALDPDHGGSSPDGFYRSMVGNLALRTTEVTGRAPLPSPSGSPSESPDVSPSEGPSEEPSSEPSPSASEEVTPTPDLSSAPTATATPAAPTPSPEPSVEPSAAPTAEPTSNATQAP